MAAQSRSIIVITVILLFHFLGVTISGFADTSGNDTIVQTLVFNASVFAQISNWANPRRLDRKPNIFEGTFNNWHSMAITLIEITIQVVIMFIGGTAFQVTRIKPNKFIQLPAGNLEDMVLSS